MRIQPLAAVAMALTLSAPASTSAEPSRPDATPVEILSRAMVLEVMNAQRFEARAAAAPPERPAGRGRRRSHPRHVRATLLRPRGAGRDPLGDFEDAGIAIAEGSPTGESHGYTFVAMYGREQGGPWVRSPR